MSLSNKIMYRVKIIIKYQLNSTLPGVTCKERRSSYISLATHRFAYMILNQLAIKLTKGIDIGLNKQFSIMTTAG